MAADDPELLLTGTGHRNTVNADIPFRDIVETVDGPQEGALTCTAEADDSHKLAVPNG